MSTIFTKIIEGEIPSYKLYEDDKTCVFLDLDQSERGHCLVVPKTEVDKLYDLPDDYYLAVMQTAKKMSEHLEKKLNTRILWRVIGVDVPHAHIHLLPFSEDWSKMHSHDPVELSPEEMSALRDQLKLD